MHLFTDNVAVVLVIKSESDIFINNGLFETHFFDTYVSCSLTFVLYTSGNVQLIGLQDSRDSQNHGFWDSWESRDSQTPETPNIPNFESIGSPGVQTPETPKTLKMLRQLGVSGVWTPGLPIPLKYGILGVSGVWESGLPKPSILVVLGVQESNQLTIA